MCNAAWADRARRSRVTVDIDQACGAELDAVLAARRRIARRAVGSKTWSLLGAVLADLERFAEADAVYRRRFIPTTAFRRSRWPGSAFSSACCGGNSRRT